MVEPISPDPLTNPLFNLDSTGGYRANAGWRGSLCECKSLDLACLSLTSFGSPPDLFFSMAGLTSSVASAVSELSLSDVDLGSSVHSNMASRRLSALAHTTGESGTLGSLQGKGELEETFTQWDVRCMQEVPRMPGDPPSVISVPQDLTQEAGDTKHGA